MTTEYLKKILEKAEESNLTILTKLSERDNKSSRFKFTCNICGEDGETSINNFMDPRRANSIICQKCLTKQKFLDKLNEKYKRNPYTFITPFVDYETSITVKCNDCGDIFTAEHAKSLLMNSKLPEFLHPCKKCTELRRNSNKSINDLEELLKEKFGECNYTFPHPELYTRIS